MCDTVPPGEGGEKEGEGVKSSDTGVPATQIDRGHASC